MTLTQNKTQHRIRAVLLALASCSVFALPHAHAQAVPESQPLRALSMAPDAANGARLSALVQRGTPRAAAWREKQKQTKLATGVSAARASAERSGLATKLRARRAAQNVSATEPVVAGEQRAQARALNESAQARGGIEAHFDPGNGTLTYLALPKRAGNPAGAKAARPAAAPAAATIAKAFMTQHRALLKLDDPATETQLTREQREVNGHAHLRFQQMFRGVPVAGREILVHLDADHEVYLLQGRYQPTPRSDLETTPSISTEMALKAIEGDIGGVVSTQSVTKQDLVIHTATDGSTKLAYRIVSVPSLSERWIHFVDAHRGVVLDRIFDVQEASVAASGADLRGTARNFDAWSGSGTNYMIDVNLPSNDDGAGYDPVAAINAGNPLSDTFILTARNGDGSNLNFVTSPAVNSSWDRTAVSALTNTRTVFEYYRNVHNRNSIDGKNGSLLAVVHFGSNEDNAFWSSPYMVYGDGGSVFSPLAGCLDVAAHEMTHGVIENTAGLIYQNQSGALNESFADIFGAMVDRGNWTLGEDCTRSTPGYLRNMANPALGLRAQPTKMSQYKQLPNTKAGDNGGVHVNSGIPNRAAYLMAEGLTAEGLGTSIDRKRTEQIFYRALTTYLTQSSQFVDARRATIRAAEDLFAADASVAASVRRAWDLVEVTDNTSSTPAPKPTDPVIGEDLMIYLTLAGSVPTPASSSGYDIWVQKLARPFSGYAAAADRGAYNATILNTRHTRPAVFSYQQDGRLLTDIYYVDTGGDVRYATFDPATLALLEGGVLTSTGDFSSIAISPDGRYFAYTNSDAADNRIFFIGLVDGAGDFVVAVLPESHVQDDVNHNTIFFADALHFDYSGRFLIFDALNCASVPESSCSVAGGGFTYWSIGRIEIPTQEVRYLIPNQDPLVDTGNPVFATNNRNIIALDVVDRRDANPRSKVVTWNLEQQTEQLVYDLDTKGLGLDGGSRPSFWGEDDFVTFLRPDDLTGRTTYRLGLDAAGAVRGGTPQQLNPKPATMPVMHRAGTRVLTGGLSVNVALLDFGLRTENTNLQFTLTNNGNSDVSITRIEIDRPDVYATQLSNSVIPRGTSATFDVTFAPGNLSGTQTGNLVITTDGQPSQLSVSLTGLANRAGGGGGGGGGCAMARAGQTADWSLALLVLLALSQRYRRRAKQH